MIIYALPLNKLETVLAQTVEGHLNGETQTLRPSHISNAALLNLKLLLSAGRNISSKTWLHDLFFNEDSNIPLTIFHSKPPVDYTFGEKRIVMQ